MHMDERRGVKIAGEIKGTVAVHQGGDMGDAGPDFGAAHGIAPQTGFEEKGRVGILAALEKLVHRRGAMLQVPQGMDQHLGFVPGDLGGAVELVHQGLEGRASGQEILELRVTLQVIRGLRGGGGKGMGAAASSSLPGGAGGGAEMVLLAVRRWISRYTCPLGTR